MQEVNEEWISDKTRFACDGLKRQRLITPMLKNNVGEMVSCDWEDVLIYTAKKLKSVDKSKVAGLVGPMVDAETLVAFKDFLNKMGCETLCTEQDFPVSGSGIDFRSNYILNDTISGNAGN